MAGQELHYRRPGRDVHRTALRADNIPSQTGTPTPRVFCSTVFRPPSCVVSECCLRFAGPLLCSTATSYRRLATTGFRARATGARQPTDWGTPADHCLKFPTPQPRSSSLAASLKFLTDRRRLHTYPFIHSFIRVLNPSKLSRTAVTVPVQK